MNLTPIVALLVLGALAGCGPDSVGAAATSAAGRKQELEQSQKALEQSKQRIEQAQQVQRERLRAAE
jgi:hypothetical protein